MTKTWTPSERWLKRKAASDRAASIRRRIEEVKLQYRDGLLWEREMLEKIDSLVYALAEVSR